MMFTSFTQSAPVLFLLAAAVLPACSGGDAGDVSAASDEGRVFQLGAGTWDPEASNAAASSGNGDAGSRTETDGGGAASGVDGGSGCETETTFVWFPDEDGDGFGVTSGGIRTCSKPPGRWAAAGGDCFDTDARVNPAQRIYFPEPYVNASGEPTFDYDCNGYEDSDPRQPGGSPQCGVLSITACGGTGYLATERYGEGVNVLCGSRSMLTCKPNTLGLLCGPEHALVDAAHRCH